MATDSDTASVPEVAAGRVAAAPDAMSASKAASVADTNLATDLPLIPPAPAQGAAGTLLSLLAAIVLHGALAAFVSWPHKYLTVGADGDDINAISVDVISSLALQSRANRADLRGSPSSAPLADREGDESQQAAAIEAPDQRTEKAPEAPAKAADLVNPDILARPAVVQPDEAQIVMAPSKIEVTAPTQDALPDVPQPKPQPTVAAAPSIVNEDQVPTNLGGVTAQDLSPAALAAQAAAILRAGQRDAYGTSVYSAVLQNAKRVQRSGRGADPVKVEFAVGFDGSVARARIVTSSGDAKFDQAALDTVKTAKFPNPPAGSLLGELEYSITFR